MFTVRKDKINQGGELQLQELDRPTISNQESLIQLKVELNEQKQMEEEQEKRK